MSEPPPQYEPPSPYVPVAMGKDQNAPDPVYQQPPPQIHIPQAPGFYQQGPHMQPVIVQPGAYMHGPTTIIIGALSFGEEPQSMTCPNCHAQIVSGVRPRAGLLAWLICGGLTLFGCWLCCFIPFCLQRCQDVDHYCPNCKRLLGVHRRI